jgi:hypothetical protein
MEPRRKYALNWYSYKTGYQELVVDSDVSHAPIAESDFQYLLDKTPVRPWPYQRGYVKVGDTNYMPYDVPGSHEPLPHDAVPGSNVCEACEDIEIAQLFANGPSKIYSLGWLKEVTACTSCDLCRLVTRGIGARAAEPEETHSMRPTTPLKYKDAFFVVLECLPSVTPNPRVRRERPHELRVIVIDSGTRERRAHIILRLLGTSAARVGKESRFHGRLVGPGAARFELAREWLRECCSAHGCALNPSAARGNSGPSQRIPGTRVEAYPDAQFSTAPTESSHEMLRVIDTTNNNLCMIPWSGRYLALSYVWPRFDALHLTRDNIDDLYTPGPLVASQERLARVIQDAMQVVRDLGAQFLWVDALCITQDDDVEKAALIGAMDQVYGKALLTILVATAANPQQDYGIPGVGRTPRPLEQFAAKLEGLEIVTALPRLDVAINSSFWSTRGWTFREILLSRRCLIFTDDQMYFRCPQDYRCENVEAEGAARLMKHPARPLSLTQGHPQLDYLMGDVFRDNMSKDKIFHFYSLLVSEYTRRSFTKPEDILNGFLGVMTVLASHLPWPNAFFLGHPMAIFGRALLWYPTSRMERRVTAKGAASFSLPSWSWAGWKGSVGYEKDAIGIGDSDLQSPLVKWMRKNGEMLDPINDRLDFVHMPPSSAMEEMLSEAEAMTPSQLICYGQCIRLSVSKKESYITHWLVDSFRGLSCLTLLDDAGDPCGLMPSPDQDWGKRHLQSEGQQTHEFLCLSFSAQSPFDDTLMRSEWFHPKYKFKVPTEAERAVPIYFSNVMLLEYDDKGVASRRGIGRIHLDSKKWAHSSMKAVVLSLSVLWPPTRFRSWCWGPQSYVLTSLCCDISNKHKRQLSLEILSPTCCSPTDASSCTSWKADRTCETLSCAQGRLRTFRVRGLFLLYLLFPRRHRPPGHVL